MSTDSSSEEDSFTDVCNYRDRAPSHYLLHVESFSSLTKMLKEGGLQCYKSKVFEASGYKWKLSIYPNGDASRSSEGYISMFLSIEDTSALPKRWEIYTNLKFFIFDQNRDKYLIFQDDQVSRFHQLKRECGVKELISRDEFDDAANGCLVNDRCAFGVEVFVLDSKFSGECLSPSVKVDKTYTWKVFKFSHLGGDGTIHYSKEFDAESFKWKLAFYPRGNRKPYGKHLSLHLELVDPGITSPRLLVHFELSVLNQKSENHIRLKLVNILIINLHSGAGMNLRC